jgi:heme exporter protein A
VLSVNALECVRGERRLFSGVNFELKPQTLLEVRGANGSGKTSLLRLLCGLLAPASGCIEWNGGDIHASGEEYRAQFAYIGHLNAVKDELSGLENLLFSARIAGLVCNAASAEQALHELGLSDFRHLPCKVLSQGQRRRVALARLYLSAARPLWILDEPFAALDSAACELVRARLESHLQQGGMVVLSTHHDIAISARSTQRLELGQ